MALLATLPSRSASDPKREKIANVLTEGGEVAQAFAVLQRLAPGGRSFEVRSPIEPDEATWFNRALAEGLVAFRECDVACPRFKKWGVAGPDEFLTPAGARRHLFSSPHAPVAWLNREYVPHIAAYARAILEFGYDRASSAFSLYRRFGRDLVSKRAGGNYETDVEFCRPDGTVVLHVEVKAERRQVERIAAEIDRVGHLDALPAKIAKEIEYVLDLEPRIFWLVGPGSVEPARHVFAVDVAGLDARFTRLAALPGAGASEGGPT